MLEGNWKEVLLFAGGVLFGTKGIRVLASDEAKKVYTQVTAAVLRERDEVMTCVQTIRENCEDIYADAVEINEKLAAEKESKEMIIGDTAAAAE